MEEPQPQKYVLDITVYFNELFPTEEEDFVVSGMKTDDAWVHLYDPDGIIMRVFQARFVNVIKVHGKREYTELSLSN